MFIELHYVSTFLMLSGAKTKTVQILRITVAEPVKVRHSYKQNRTLHHSTYWVLVIYRDLFVTPCPVDL